MANKQALRELQTRLAERMQAARTQPRGQSWLAVECRGHGLLLPLEQAGEIFAVVPLLEVAHTQPWFAGVANLRGGLYGVVDLARFLGLPDAPDGVGREQARLVAIGATLGLNSALPGRPAHQRSAACRGRRQRRRCPPGVRTDLLARCRRPPMAVARPRRAGQRRALPLDRGVT
jgi:CheW-like domain